MHDGDETVLVGAAAVVGDRLLQRSAVEFLVLGADVGQVDLRATHHQTDQIRVASAEALKDMVTMHSTGQSRSGQPE